MNFTIPNHLQNYTWRPLQENVIFTKNLGKT